MSEFAMDEEMPTAVARRTRIVKAALEVFLRYGYARTKMADIAHEAGLSRPTLYLTFPDKESVFRAVVEMTTGAKFTAIREGLPAIHDIEAKLSFACEIWGVQGLELVLANPSAKDVLDSSYEPVRESYATFAGILVDILSEPLSRVSLSMTAPELARILVFGIKGFKDAARDGDDMRVMVRTLTKTVSAALRPSSGAQ